jgi:hypothetical protein
LQGLRDGLAKLGFLPQPQLKEKTAPPMGEDSRAVRPRRPMRQTRLSTIQRLALVVENVRQQIEQTPGIEPKETVAEKAGQTESVKQAEKIAPNETPGQKLRREIAERRQQQHSQRRSGGIHI